MMIYVVVVTTCWSKSQDAKKQTQGKKPKRKNTQKKRTTTKARHVRG
jgi:hypothetical protein